MAKKKNQPSTTGFMDLDNKAVVSTETKEPKKKSEKKAPAETVVETPAEPIVEAAAAPAVEADTTSEEPAPESAE